MQRLHGRYPLFLLSNTNDMHREDIVRRFPFFARFAGGVFSYEVTCSKPDPRIFQIAIERCALEPARTFFIDDNLANIDAARALGFQTHHYDFARHEELLAALREAGVE